MSRRGSRDGVRRTRGPVNMLKEVEYIRARASARDARVVGLGSLVFFSTATGDAWMLDPGDQAALLLARDGSPLPAEIIETEETFAVSWTSTYRIHSDVFTYTDPSGRVRSIIGYPTEQILEACARALGGEDHERDSD